MTFEEAVVTLFKFKHVEGTVGEKAADKAREVLQQHYGKTYKLRPAPHTTIANEPFVDVPAFQWADLWLDDAGEQVAHTSHAYDLNGDDLRRILAYGDRNKLKVRVTGLGSWKNAGHCVIVEYRR